MKHRAALAAALIGACLATSALAAGKGGISMVFRRTTVEIEGPPVITPPSPDMPWLAGAPPEAPKRGSFTTDIREAKSFADAGLNELAPFARVQALLVAFPGNGPATLAIRGSFPECDVVAIDAAGTVARIYSRVHFNQTYVETDIPASALMLLPAGKAKETGIMMGDRAHGQFLPFAGGKTPQPSGRAIQPPPSTRLPQ